MSPQPYQAGPSHSHGDAAQSPQGTDGGPHLHGAPRGAHGYGYAYGPPPWAAYAPPWHAAYFSPHAHPHGPYSPGFAWGPPPPWGLPGPAQDANSGAAATGLLNNRFVMGMLVRGALTYVLTNEAIQRAAIRGIMQVWLSVQGGLEEAKERFRDAESEIKASRGG